jgi:S1-C subfamily serine protease
MTRKGIVLILAFLVGSLPVLLLRPQKVVYKTVYKTTVQQFSIAPQVEQVRGAVVHIRKTTPDGGGCQGSGCLIDPNGILFTARHVSDGDPCGVYTVTLDDGKQYPVKYVIEDRENDVTLMKLDLPPGAGPLPYARLAKGDDLRVGDALFIFGSPLGQDNFNTVSFGILSAANRNLAKLWPEGKQYDWHVMFQTTSPAFPGNSGGPVFNMRGEAIGVLVAGMAETLNYSVPVARFRDTIGAVRSWFDLCRFRVIQPDMRGPQGPQGPPGECGPQGPPGEIVVDVNERG